MNHRSFGRSAFERATFCPAYSVDLGRQCMTGGLPGEPCGLIESIVVSRDAPRNEVVISIDFEDGRDHNLAHRWFRMNRDEARKIATALLNAVDTE